MRLRLTDRARYAPLVSDLHKDMTTLEVLYLGIKYLNIDTDLDIAYAHADIWAERGIGIDRVDNITEGIKLLMRNDYLFVGINADVIDFMPLLSTMRSVTNNPI